MAEIRIQRKRSVWPWIIGLLVLVGVAWLLYAALGDDRTGMEQATADRPVERTAGDPAVATSGRVPDAVQAYAEFADEQASGSPGREHEYTAEGIRRLTAALAAHVERDAGNAEARRRFERFRTIADRLQRDPGSGKHAGMVRDSFTSAVDVFESSRIHAGDVSGLRQTASSIAPDRPLLDQIDQVQEFFRESAGALERASRS